MKLTEREVQQLFQKMTVRDSAKSECLGEDVLLRAATGELTSQEREKAAAHIARCSDCAREYQIARGLRPLRGDVQPAAARFPLAAAAALMIAIGALIAMFVMQRQDRQTIAALQRQIATRPSSVVIQQPSETFDVGTPVVDLDPDVERGAATSTSIAVPSEHLTLILHLPEGMRAPLDVTVDGGRSKRVDVAGDALHVTVSRGNASPGPHIIEVRSPQRTVRFQYNVRQ